MPELERAFARLVRAIEAINSSGDWNPLADAFEEDAVMRRSAVAPCHGREQIRSLLLTAAATWPISQIERIDIVWHAVDHERRRVVHEMRYVMRDPGDGSVHQSSATTLLTLGAHGLWSSAEETMSTESRRLMLRSWVRAAQRCGSLDRDPTEVEQVLSHLDGIAQPPAQLPQQPTSSSLSASASSSFTTR